MKKLLTILFITTMISYSHASYLDNWTNDDLCGWMESYPIPKNILDEVVKREILCSGGIEVSVLPIVGSNNSPYGTVMDSPDPSLIPESKSDNNSDYSY